MAKPPTLISNTSLAMVREPRCRCCKSVLRDRIDRLAAAGFGGSAIADEIMGLDPNLPKNRDSLRKAIERHVTRHLKVKDAAIRQILENRAREQGILLEEYQGRLVSGKAFIDMMVAQGIEQISDPNARVYNKDVLEAIRMQEEFERNNFAAQLEVIERQVRAMSQAVREIIHENVGRTVTEDLYEAIASRARFLFDGDERIPANKPLEIEEGEVIEQ